MPRTVHIGCARGENKGRQLRYVSIVRNIQRVGSIDRAGMFKKQVPIRAADSQPAPG